MSMPAAVGSGRSPCHGRGGLSRVAEATGLSRVTIRAGLQELACADTASGLRLLRRVRRRGGGRKPLSLHDPHLLHTLETLVDPVTRGDPMSLLRWTCKVRPVGGALRAQGHRVSERRVNRLSMTWVTVCSPTGRPWRGAAPDRDAQFQYINRRAKPSRSKATCGVGRYQKEGIGWPVRMVVASGIRRDSLRRSRSTTSPARRWARSFLTASMTKPRHWLGQRGRGS